MRIVPLIAEILGLIPNVIALWPQHRGLADDIGRTLEHIIENAPDLAEGLTNLRNLVVVMVAEKRDPTLEELDALRVRDNEWWGRLKAAAERRGIA